MRKTETADKIAMTMTTKIATIRPEEEDEEEDVDETEVGGFDV